MKIREKKDEKKIKLRSKKGGEKIVKISKKYLLKEEMFKDKKLSKMMDDIKKKRGGDKYEKLMKKMIKKGHEMDLEYLKYLY